MTPEQVIAEVMGHLAQRSSPKDHLVPLANFLGMLNGQRRHIDGQDMIARRPGGQEAIAAHRQARLERRQAYERDLVAASEAGLSLAVVARAYGYPTSRVARSIVQALALKRSTEPMDEARLVAVARIGMTVTELATAAGYNPDSLRNWLGNGRLAKLFVLGQRHTLVHYIKQIRSQEAA